MGNISHIPQMYQNWCAVKNFCWSHRTRVEVGNEQDIFQNYWETKRNSDKTTFESYTVSQKRLFIS